MRVLFWDVCAWAFVLFPFFTGGVWVQRPGLRLELSQLNGPVAALAVLALIFHFGFKDNLGQASSWRFVRALWQRWADAMARKHLRTLLAAFAFVAALWAFNSLRRHWAFSSGAADLGIFVNAIWNLVNGFGYMSSVKDGVQLFTDHQSPIFWAFAPIFLISERAETLLIAQALILASGGIAVYFLGRQYLRGKANEKKWLAALPLLYWAYNPTRNANAFDFHPEATMLPLFLWAIVGLQSRRWGPRGAGFLLMLAALAGKESAPPVAVGIAIAWILGASPVESRVFTRAFAGMLAIGSVALFLFYTKVVPGLYGGEYLYQSNFSHLGNSLGEILLAPLLKPIAFFSQVLNKARLKFLFEMLAPLAFLPLLNWRALIAAAPGFAMLFLSSGDHRISTGYHYSIEPSVGLFWALPGAILVVPKFVEQLRGSLAYLAHFLRPLTRVHAGIWILFFALVAHGRSEMQRWRWNAPSAHHDWLRAELFPALQPEATLSVSGALLPHLANRHWTHHLPRVYMMHGREMEGTEPLDCVIWDPQVNNWPLQTHENEKVEKFMGAHFELEFQCADLRLWHRKNGEKCLMRKPACPATNATATAAL